MLGAFFVCRREIAARGVSCASRFQCLRVPNLAKKWIGQKKAIGQWQFFESFMTTRLKFC
jgi:hypothetical protein